MSTPPRPPANGEPTWSADVRPLQDPAWIYRLIRSMGGDTHAADDVVQELWLAVLSQRSRPTGNRWVWLRGLARSTFLKQRRGERRRRRREARAARPEDTIDDVRAVERRSVAEWLRRQIDALGEPERTMLHGRYHDALSPHEIAARHGLPLETVRTRLRRARAKLRARIERETEPERRPWWSFLLLPIGLRTPTASSPAAAAAVATLLAGVGLAILGVIASADSAPPPREPRHESPRKPRRVAAHRAPLVRTKRTETSPPITHVEPPFGRRFQPRPQPIEGRTGSRRPTDNTGARPMVANADAPVVRGVVVDDAHEPVAGAEVTAFIEFPEGLRRTGSVAARHRVLTDSAGRFALPALRGPFFLKATFPGLATCQRRGRVGTETTLTLGRPGEIRGRVLDVTTREPVAGIVVGVTHERSIEFLRGFDRRGVPCSTFVRRTDQLTKTNDRGEWSVPNLRAGWYEVAVGSAGRGFDTLERRIVRVTPGSTRTLVTPRPSRHAFAVEGIVLDAITGDPVPHARIHPRLDPRRFVTTDRHGVFRLGGCFGDAVDVSITHRGYVGETATLRPADDSVTRVKLVRPARARGRVIDPHGHPVAGARVAHDPIALHASRVAFVTTAEDGTFEIGGLRPGVSHRLFAAAPGHAPGYTEPFTLRPRTRRTGVAIRLAAAGSIAGRLVGMSRRATLALQAVDVGDDAGLTPSAFYGSVTTDRSGAFRFPDVRPGRYRIAAWIDLDATVFPDVVDVRPHTTTTVALASDATRTIAGCIRTDRGVPLHGATIERLNDDGTFVRCAVSDAHGRFTLRNVPATTARLRVTKDRWRARRIDAAPGGPPLDVVLERAQPLVGHVVDGRTGKPAPFFWVRVYPHTGQAERRPRKHWFCDPRGRFSLRRSRHPWLPTGAFDLEAGTDDGALSRRLRDLRTTAPQPRAPIILTLSPRDE